MRRSVLVLLLLVLFAVSADATHAATYVRDPLTDRLTQKPRKLDFRDVELTGLRWVHWGWSRAIGKGKASLLICEPSCADGRRVRTTVRVVLRKRVAEGDRRVYQCIEGRLKRVPRAYQRIRWGC